MASLDAAVLEDETGVALPPGRQAYTGTMPDGNATVAPHCADWTDSAALGGAIGRVDVTDPSWTQQGFGNCTFPRSVYCVEGELAAAQVPAVGPGWLGLGALVTILVGRRIAR